MLGGRSGQCKVKIAVLSQFTDCWTKFHMICWKSATGITFHSHSSIPIPVHSFPQSHSYSYYHDIVIVSLIAIGPMGSQLFPFPTTSLPYFYLLPFQFVRLGSCESLRYTILRYLSPSSVLYVVMRVSGFTYCCCSSVGPFLRSFVHLSPKCVHKNAVFSKRSNLEPWFLLTTYRKFYMSLSKNPLLDT